MEKTVTPYMLPTTEEYLCVLEHLSQEMAAGEFPGICQISSLFLFAYLRKQGIEGRIICGDYEEKGELSPHFWVETEKEIVDGTTVQFKMGTIDKCPLFLLKRKEAGRPKAPRTQISFDYRYRRQPSALTAVTVRTLPSPVYSRTTVSPVFRNGSCSDKRIGAT